MKGLIKIILIIVPIFVNSIAKKNYRQNLIGNFRLSKKTKEYIYCKKLYDYKSGRF